jgi:O-antigen ligase
MRDVGLALRRLSFGLLWLTIFAIPWENVLTLEGVGTLSRLVGLSAACVGLLSVALGGDVRRPGPLFAAATAFAAWNALSLFWTIDSGLSVLRVFTYVQLLLLVWLIGEFAPGPAAVRALMLAYVLGASVSAANTVANYRSGAETTYLRYAAFGFDSNDLGLILALGVPLAWYLVLAEERRFARWAAALYLPLALIGVLLTASRGAFLATIIAASMVVWSFWRLHSRAKWLVLIAATGVAGGALTLVPESSWRRLSTVTTEVTSGTMNQRTDIWRAGADAFPASPLLGVGAGAFRVAVEPRLGVPRAAHNAFLGILVEAGLVGFSVFCVMLLAAIALIWHMPPLERRLWLVVGSAWAVGVMSLSWEHRKPTWVMLGLLAAHAAAAGRPGSAPIQPRRAARRLPEGE